MDELPRIPGYEIRGELGSGGMATVYLAIQQNLDRKIALKIMSAEMADDETFCKRFSNEGKIIAQVSNHPDIVTIYDVGVVDNTYYMAMEYAGGGCLTDLLDDRIEPDVAVDIARSMAGALGFAHDHGFVHRDVKPANILFRDDGTPTLTDFGIAKSLSKNTQLTQLGYAVGTPDYMSPEQARAEKLDGRSDLYSLGVVFYEMLTGHRPYTGKDSMSVAMMHISDPVPSLPGRFDKYQPIIDSLMAKLPENRFANAGDLVKALDLLMQNKADSDPGDFHADVAARTVVNPGVMPAPPAGVTAHVESASGKKGFAGIPLWVQLGFLVLFSGLTATAVNWYIGWPNGQTGGSLPDAVVGSQIDSGYLEDSPAVDVIEADPLADKKLRDRIDLLLQVAEAHMAIGRYQEPKGANALDAYKLVLELDPGNQAARQGLAAIEKQAVVN